MSQKCYQTCGFTTFRGYSQVSMVGQGTLPHRDPSGQCLLPPDPANGDASSQMGKQNLIGENGSSWRLARHITGLRKPVASLGAAQDG